MQHCDVLIAGARFDDRVTAIPSTFHTDRKIIHIDIDPSSISKRQGRCSDVGYVADVLDEMLKRSSLAAAPGPGGAEELGRHQSGSAGLPQVRHQSESSPQFVIQKLYG